MLDADEFLASTSGESLVLDPMDEETISRMVGAGAVVGFPTETVWGLGVTAATQDAVARLGAIKGRPDGKPFQVLCADTKVALTLAGAQGEKMVQAFAGYWPGPLTLVVEAAPNCPAWLAPYAQVGLRVPDHPIAQRLAQFAGGVLVSSSLNRSGEAPARTFEDARAARLADAILRGESSAGQPSTVFDATRGVVLREGGIPSAALVEAWACAR